MNTDLLEESPLYRTWVGEARAKGEAEGRAEGRAEGEIEMARRALEAKYQTLEADVLAALAQAGPATLEEIVSRLFTDTLTDVRGRLGLPANA